MIKVNKRAQPPASQAKALRQLDHQLSKLYSHLSMLRLIPAFLRNPLQDTIELQKNLEYFQTLKQKIQKQSNIQENYLDQLTDSQRSNLLIRFAARVRDAVAYHLQLFKNPIFKQTQKGLLEQLLNRCEECLSGNTSKNMIQQISIFQQSNFDWIKQTLDEFRNQISACKINEAVKQKIKKTLVLHKPTPIAQFGHDFMNKVLDFFQHPESFFQERSFKPDRGLDMQLVYLGQQQSQSKGAYLQDHMIEKQQHRRKKKLQSRDDIPYVTIISKSSLSNEKDQRKKQNQPAISRGSSFKRRTIIEIQNEDKPLLQKKSMILGRSSVRRPKVNKSMDIRKQSKNISKRLLFQQTDQIFQPQKRNSITVPPSPRKLTKKIIKHRSIGQATEISCFKENLLVSKQTTKISLHTNKSAGKSQAKVSKRRIMIRRQDNQTLIRNAKKLLKLI